MPITMAVRVPTWLSQYPAWPTLVSLLIEAVNDGRSPSTTPASGEPGCGLVCSAGSSSADVPAPAKCACRACNSWAVVPSACKSATLPLWPAASSKVAGCAPATGAKAVLRDLFAGGWPSAASPPVSLRLDRLSRTQTWIEFSSLLLCCPSARKTQYEKLAYRMGKGQEARQLFTWPRAAVGRRSARLYLGQCCRWLHRAWWCSGQQRSPAGSAADVLTSSQETRPPAQAQPSMCTSPTGAVLVKPLVIQQSMTAFTLC